MLLVGVGGRRDRLQRPKQHREGARERFLDRMWFRMRCARANPLPEKPGGARLAHVVWQRLKQRAGAPGGVAHRHSARLKGRSDGAGYLRAHVQGRCPHFCFLRKTPTPPWARAASSRRVGGHAPRAT